MTKAKLNTKVKTKNRDGKEDKKEVRAGKAALQFLPLEFPWAVVQQQGLLHLSAR